MASGSDLTAALDSFETFGDLLRYLRRRAKLTQRELGVAVGYNYSHISRLENDLRVPDVATLHVLFLPALRLNPVDDAPVVTRLAELAARAAEPELHAAHPYPRAGERSWSTSVDAWAHGAVQVPRQLPPPARHFVGRRAEWEALKRLADESVGPGAAVVISVIDGTAGVGKTALAVHWAHRFADWFPDGQLYVNLRGFDPSAPPVPPTVAVRGFLDAFAVPPERVPATLEAQVGLYRSVLAGKRVLILLDNAAAVEQVRPLLPGQPGCLVVVTSRRQLPGLTALEGAKPITLGLLTGAEARELLTYHLDQARVDADPGATEEIISRCAGLPLALAIVAARACAHPDFPLHAFADELHATRSIFDALHDQDPTTDVRTVLSWSYQRLGADVARLFRLLGSQPGPDIVAPTAASLAGVPLSMARAHLAELASGHLLAEPAPGRYALHDLLRAYAAEKAQARDGHVEHRAALRRLLDHYLHTAYAAGRLIYPTRDPILLATPQPGVTPHHIGDQQQALAWFESERAGLEAALESAVSEGFDTHVWQLAWTLATFLERRGRWSEWVAAGHVALAAAERLDDAAVRALSHRELGFAYCRMGRLDDAHGHLCPALDLYRRIGDRAGQGHTHQGMCMLVERRGDFAAAGSHARQAIELFRDVGHRHGQAQALNNLGWMQAHLGEFDQALTSCRQALSLLVELGSRDGQADTWDSLGYAHHRLGQHAQAVACHQMAIDLYGDLGDHYYEAEALVHLGDTHLAAGAADAARHAWQRALTILVDLDLDLPDVGRANARLLNLGGA